MYQTISVLMFVLAIATFAFAVYMLFEVIGCRKRNLLYVAAYLKHAEIKKNVHQGHALTGKWYKCWTVCTYGYHVDGKAYQLSCGIPGRATDAPHKVTVSVWKNAPQKGFVAEFEKPPSFGVPLFLFFGCAVEIAAAFGLWNVYC